MALLAYRPHVRLVRPTQMVAMPVWQHDNDGVAGESVPPTAGGAWIATARPV